MNDSNVIVMLIGLFALYSVVHFFIIQHSKTWKERTGYEKFVSVSAIVCIGLIFLGTMNNK